jgi:hypothetical protein
VFGKSAQGANPTTPEFSTTHNVFSSAEKIMFILKMRYVIGCIVKYYNAIVATQDRSIGTN